MDCGSPKNESTGIVLLWTLLLLLIIPACSDTPENDQEVLARINDYSITKEEFHRRLAEEARYYDKMNLNQAVVDAFLEQIIRKELLIQEAARRKLDREEKFMRSIERFWENTLIRDVLEVQSKELEKSVFVSDEDIISRYEAMRNERDMPPLDEVREPIKETLHDEKVAKAIDDWVARLREQAEISVERSMLQLSKGE